MNTTLVRKFLNETPSYRNYIESIGIDPDGVKGLTDLPIIDRHDLGRISSSVPLFRVRQIIPSSGSTGMFTSFGLFGSEELANSRAGITAFLNERFNALKQKILLLNMLPGAIAIDSPLVAVASIGVRLDTAINAITSFGSYFDQIMLISEPLFMKALVEEGVQHGIVWRHLPLQIIVGGEWISESYRLYLESIVGENRVFSSMGTAELGLNYFVESEETVALRQLMFKDGELLNDVCGDADFAPMLFVYDNTKLFIETAATAHGMNDRIIVTTIEPNRILPLIRYDIGDKGMLLSRRYLSRILSASGYGNLIASEGPAILAHFGRGKEVQGILVEKVKCLLFRDVEAAAATTGQFVLSGDVHGTKLKIQLKKKHVICNDLQLLFRKVFKNLSATVEMIPYEMFSYPMDFERKTRYTLEADHCRI